MEHIINDNKKKRNGTHHKTPFRGASREKQPNPIAKLCKIREELKRTQKCVKRYIDSMWKMTNIYYETNIKKRKEFDYMSPSSSAINLTSDCTSQLNIMNPLHVLRFPSNQEYHSTSQSSSILNEPVGLYEFGKSFEEKCQYSNNSLSNDLSDETRKLSGISVETVSKRGTEKHLLKPSTSTDLTQHRLRRSNEVYSFFEEEEVAPKVNLKRTSTDEENIRYLLRRCNDSAYNKQFFIESDNITSLFADITQEKTCKSSVRQKTNSNEEEKMFIRADKVDSLFEELKPEQIFTSSPDTASEKTNFSLRVLSCPNSDYNNCTTSPYPLREKVTEYRKQRQSFKPLSSRRKRYKSTWSSNFLRDDGESSAKKRQLLTNQYNFSPGCFLEYSDEEKPYTLRKTC